MSPPHTPPPQSLKFTLFSSAVTLEIRARSPKSNQVFIMSQCYIHTNLVPICPPVHEISCTQESVPWRSPHHKQYVPSSSVGGGGGGQGRGGHEYIAWAGKILNLPGTSKWLNAFVQRKSYLPLKKLYTKTCVKLPLKLALKDLNPIALRVSL